MTRLKIRKIGNSLGVVLPKDVLDQLKSGKAMSSTLCRPRGRDALVV